VLGGVLVGQLARRACGGAARVGDRSLRVTGGRGLVDVMGDGCDVGGVELLECGGDPGV
jgi:hypothetical protein